MKNHSRTFRGYLALHRRIYEHELWTRLPESWFRVFMAVLGLANWKPAKWWNGKDEIEIPAGSFVSSVENIRLFARVTVPQCRAALEYLERTKSIARQTTSHYTIVTVCNWYKYQAITELTKELLEDQAQAEKQAEKQSDSKAGASRAQADSKPGATIEESKNLRREEGEEENRPPTVRQFRTTTETGFAIPHEYEGFDTAGWLHTRWLKHPKTGKKHLAEQYACEKLFRPEPRGFLPDDFNRVHDAWILYWQQNPRELQFGGPTLAEFIYDDWWQRMPPAPTPSAPSDKRRAIERLIDSLPDEEERFDDQGSSENSERAIAHGEVSRGRGRITASRQKSHRSRRQQCGPRPADRRRAA